MRIPRTRTSETMARWKTIIFSENSSWVCKRWKHPCDTSRGCAFLSKSVPHHLVRFLRRQWLLVDIIDHPLTSPLHSRLRIPTSFLPTYPPLTIGRVGPFEKGVHPPASSSALRPGDWLIPRAISTPPEYYHGQYSYESSEHDDDGREWLVCLFHVNIGNERKGDMEPW